MKKRSILLIASALLLLSCNESIDQESICGNNMLDAGEACENVEGVVQFADGARVCVDGLELVDIAKFECNACVAVAGEGACVKKIESCGNNTLDADELCDVVEGVVQFADDARVCADCLELADITKFECNACVAVAGDGACVKKEVLVCGNNTLDADELCDVVEGVVQFADGARVCTDGLELADITKFECQSDCQPAILAGACIAKASCGNKALDADEVCDIDGDGVSLFAAGSQKCADGFVIDDLNKIVCKSDCTVDASACVLAPRCGDGIKNGEELCDAEDFGDSTCASHLGEGAKGKLVCNADCMGINLDSCSLCGNRIIEDGELCDSDNFEGKTCGDFGGSVDVGDLVCTASCLIDSSACKSCVDGTRECLGGTLKLCVDKVWTEASDSTCDKGYVCKEGENACTKHANYCEHGKCEDNMQYACVDKILQAGIACEAYQACKTGFYTCQNNEKYCETPKCSLMFDTFEACVDNQLQASVACGAGYECLFYNQACEKKINYCEADKCLVETSTDSPNFGKAMFRVCTDHEWGTASECSGGASCINATSCGVCKNENVKCEGNVYHSCSAGQWNTGIDCGAIGQVCDTSVGCIEAIACGNSSVEGQEICDASNASHMLSGAGTLCHTYDSARYSDAGNNAMVKCSTNCTIDDSACTHKTRVGMGMCRFESLTNTEVNISYTAETGSVAGAYQFRLACEDTIGSDMKFWTDIRTTFDIFTVAAKNNEPAEVTYTIDVSKKSPGSYYCALQYRRGSTLSVGNWANYETELCSAKPGLKGQMTTSVSADDLLLLTIP